MKTAGTWFIVLAIVAGAIGFVHSSSEGLFESSFEALYEQTMARHVQEHGRPDLGYVAKFGEDYERAKASRLLTRNVAFGLAALLFVSGIICIANGGSKSDVHSAILAHCASNEAKPSGAVIDPKVKLEKLLAMRTAGLITETDYERQKAVVLEEFVRS